MFGALVRALLGSAISGEPCSYVAFDRTVMELGEIRIDLKTVLAIAIQVFIFGAIAAR